VEGSSDKNRNRVKDTDFLLIFLPVLAAVTLFVLVLSDKFNIKLFGKNYVQEVAYRRNTSGNVVSVKPVIQDEVAYSSVEEEFSALTKNSPRNPGFTDFILRI